MITFPARYFQISKKTLACLSLACVALPSLTRAATVSALTETSTSISFNFSGNGFADFFFLPPLTYWSSTLQGMAINPAHTLYAYEVDFRYLANPIVALGSLTPSTPFGTTLSDTKTVGPDTFTFAVTVNKNANNDWGAFNGTFSGVHSAATGVPDGGATAAMLGAGMLGLIGLKRRLRLR